MSAIKKLSNLERIQDLNATRLVWFTIGFFLGVLLVNMVLAEKPIKEQKTENVEKSR